MTNSFFLPLMARARGRAQLRKSMRRIWQRRMLLRQRAKYVFAGFSKKLERQLRTSVSGQQVEGVARYSRGAVQRRLRLVGGQPQ